MLARDIMKELVSWKNRPHHPIVISGMRQSGKTYIVKAFGKENYENVVYIDLRAEKSIHSVFDGDFDVDRMVLGITASLPSARFVKDKTLVILDEIQDCPNARSSLKYWDTDNRYDVIATGSFLSVKGFRAPYPRGVPVGYEEHISMYPLSFREFLANAGLDEGILSYVQNAFEKGQTIDNTVHHSMRALYLQYLIVGGMPEAVDAFFRTHDVNLVRSIQKRIIKSISDDFGRYKDRTDCDRINESLKLRAEACLKSLPSQLSKEYKKFQYSLVESKGNSPEKAEGVEYLEDVGLVIRAYNTRELSFPLEGAKIAREFKVFSVDTGLLVSMLGEEVPQKILSGDLSAYKGAVAENMVASAFVTSGRSLYYYHAPSGSPELDFVYEDGEDIVIVECKSTNNRATSMKFVLSNPKRFGSHRAVKFADTNVGPGEGFVTYPLYCLGFLRKKEKNLIVDTVDVSKLKIQF